jgi:hypothetical protein
MSVAWSTARADQLFSQDRRAVRRTRVSPKGRRRCVAGTAEFADPVGRICRSCAGRWANDWEQTPLMSPAIPPTGTLPPRPAANPSGDYRSMVEAIQTDDLPAAQQAFGRFTRGLPAASYDATTTLGKIGAALDQGDLKSAQSILDGLETKAMKVVRAVQQVTEGEKRDGVPPGSTFRITV